MNTDASIDAALWQSARQGDADAFTELYRRHADAVYGYCFRRTGCVTAAQDCTSTVFLEAWRKRSSEDWRDGSVLGWFFAIANNVVRNSGRASRRHRDLVMRLPQGSEHGFADEVIDRVDAEAEMSGVLRLLGNLRSSDREVIAMAAWSGLSYAEIGKALGLSESAIKSRLSRARARLKAAIRDSSTTRPPLTTTSTTINTLGGTPQ